MDINLTEENIKTIIKQIAGMSSIINVILAAGLLDINFIKARMEKLGKNTITVSNEIGISRKHYSNVIHGKANPTLKVVEDIAKALECEIPDLFTKKS